MRAAVGPLLLLVLNGVFAARAAAQSTPAAEESAPPQADAAATGSTGFAARVRLEVSHTPQGPFVQFVPRLGYDFSRWSVDVALPIEFVSASSTAQGATSHHGVGDGSLSLSFTIESDRINFLSTGLVAAPTGDSTVGLGAGQVTWDWTNHVDRLFGWLAPFLTAGVGSSAGSGTAAAAVVGARGGTQSRGLPYTTVGKQVHLDAGVDLYVGGPISWNVSAYDTIPWGDQKIISLFVPTRPNGQPLGPKGQRAFEVAAQTAGSASLTADHGFSTSIDLTPTNYFSLSVGFSRSIQLNFDVVSVSAGVNLAKLYRATRPRP